MIQAYRAFGFMQDGLSCLVLLACHISWNARDLSMMRYASVLISISGNICAVLQALNI